MDGQTVAFSEEHLPRGQAERLLPLLSETLRSAGLGWSDLAAIGVGIGPGNFTGIRISVAASRGLALSLKCPAIGISALEALALDAARPTVSVVSGRRDTIYAQVFYDKANPPFMIDRSALKLHVPSGAVIVGEGAEEIAAVLGADSASPACPRAVAIARLAAARGGRDASRPKPLYLREADAAPAAQRLTRS